MASFAGDKGSTSIPQAAVALSQPDTTKAFEIIAEPFPANFFAIIATTVIYFYYFCGKVVVYESDIL